MIEEILIFIFFAAAVFYLGRMVYKAFFDSSNGGCAKGCGSCQSTISTLSDDLPHTITKS